MDARTAALLKNAYAEPASTDEAERRAAEFLAEVQRLRVDIDAAEASGDAVSPELRKAFIELKRRMNLDRLWAKQNRARRMPSTSRAPLPEGAEQFGQVTKFFHSRVAKLLNVYAAAVEVLEMASEDGVVPEEVLDHLEEAVDGLEDAGLVFRVAAEG